MRGSREHRRRGSMYVAVLGSAMAITVMGLSAIMLARVERSSVVGTADSAAARFYAQSAIELGEQHIRQDSNWRTTYTTGVWEANRAIGTGTYTLEGIDTVDGNLSNSASDPVVLRGTGFQGQSRYKLQVTMVAKSNALTCLEVAMHAGTDLTFSSATVQSPLVTISANHNATASSSWVYPKVEVVNTTSGSYQTPTQTGITPRTMPDATVFDYYIYIANGTPIVYAGLPKSGGKTTIEKVVFSPTHNPYGLPNPKGIYVIDCGGGDLKIYNTRIVGTLVILNPGVFSVQQAVNWEPAIANYPSLLVRGNAELAFSASALSESSLSVDFNEDGDRLDTYPSLIKGLIYASGNVTTKNTVTIDGVLVIGGTLTAQNTLTLAYEPTFLDNPPPGFGGAPQMVVSPGTWKQLVD
jgi:Tfp pilus assembly protein PilX